MFWSQESVEGEKMISMHEKNFVKLLDDFNSTLFSVGLFKPIDIIIFQLIYCEVEGKQGFISADEIMEKLGVTQTEFDESMKRLDEKGVFREDPIKLTIIE